jgi:unsaturated rhamnogalacturonyl hydrolase
MRRSHFLLWISLATLAGCSGQSSLVVDPSRPWSQRIAESYLFWHPDSVTYAGEERYRWHYEVGVMLEGMRRMWERTGDPRYFDYIKRNIDRFVLPDGSILTYELDTYNLDNIPLGRQLFLLSEKTGDPRYGKAAATLRRQLTEQPRTPSGGFWHKQIYPNQMWLDGLYMAEPFYARYARDAGDSSGLNDVIRQFVLMEHGARDEKTGLLYHGWDESRTQRWADSATGHSPHFWGRAMGWYGMGLVDVLEILPRDYPGRADLVGILRRLAEALLRHRDPASKLWYQVVDLGGREGNYLEASASAMYAYVFARGAKHGDLPAMYLDAARESFRGILERLVTVDERGLVSLHDVCQVAGLGGKPYRDGSFGYYVGEPKRVNDFKGYGPFLFAALELEEAK